jgi:hypothetical protein
MPWRMELLWFHLLKESFSFFLLVFCSFSNRLIFWQKEKQKRNNKQMSSPYISILHFLCCSYRFINTITVLTSYGTSQECCEETTILTILTLNILPLMVSSHGKITWSLNLSAFCGFEFSFLENN